MTTDSILTVGVVGGSGYSGAELLRLLAGRNDVRLTAATAATAAGQPVSALYPALSGRTDLVYREYRPEEFDGTDVAFVALPSGEAMKIVPELRSHVRLVIDLGGDFRLHSAEIYQQYYRHEHTAPGLLAQAVYGLPELNRMAIAGSTFVANPGCYPTGAILGLLPALRLGLIEPNGIVINSLSGASGAGRSSAVDMSFAEINENVRAYRVGAHQHIPEMEQVLSEVAGKPVTTSFVPHLLPITRGIYTTIHATLRAPLSQREAETSYSEYYAGERFVRFSHRIPHIKSVTGTNYCDIAVFVQERTGQLVIMTVIDNLIKGAAGQAVQNMNLMCGIREETGLQ